MAGHAPPSVLKIHKETNAFTRHGGALEPTKSTRCQRGKRPQAGACALLRRTGCALIRRKSMEMLDVLRSGR
jgi:hypothetical protein